MAKIIEEKITVVLSRIVSNDQEEGLDPVLDEDQLETLQKAVEGLVDDSSVVVELEQA
jgi:hypothetical protein